MKISILKFEELDIHQLYNLLKLRTDVFVVEQDCAYPELDDFDKEAVHLLGYDGNSLTAYARILASNTVYGQPSIGRVVVKKEARQAGFGRILFKAALEEAQRLYPKEDIKIQAQTYLEEFYKSYGFETISEPYPDAGVWHIDMILKA